MLGFDALYFARIDYQDADLRRSTKSMEFVWDASKSLGYLREISKNRILLYIRILFIDKCINRLRL